MKKALKKGTGNKGLILYVILCLSFANLLATGYLVFQSRKQPAAPLEPAKAPLPAGLDTRAGRAALFDKLKLLLNAKDYDRLYLLFDETVRVQFPKDKFTKNVEDIYSITGEILSGAYRSYDVRTEPGGVKKYDMRYPIDTEKGKAVMLITVFQQGQEAYRLVGIKISKEN